MGELTTMIIVAAISGAGLVTGLLFAFSNFVMTALADLPPDKGMFAMNRINARIINPTFLLIFLGTPLLCVLICVSAWLNIHDTGNAFLLVGALAYLIGPFGITVLFNVPLNNLLARTNESESNVAWPAYRRKWQRWNHIRTLIGVVSILFMTMGLGGIPA
jgi:uncharacterized membrane protein